MDNAADSIRVTYVLTAEVVVVVDVTASSIAEVLVDDEFVDWHHVKSWTIENRTYVGQYESFEPDSPEGAPEAVELLRQAIRIADDVTWPAWTLGW